MKTPFNWAAGRLLFAIVVLLLGAEAMAAGVLTGMSGEVRLMIDEKTYGPAVVNQRIISGTTVTTGPGASAVIRFDDGQRVVLNENSAFKIADFRYAEENPAADRSFLQLFKGAMRVVTGALGKRSSGAFELRTPTVVLGVRGTDLSQFREH